MYNADGKIKPSHQGNASWLSSSLSDGSGYGVSVHSAGSARDSSNSVDSNSAGWLEQIGNSFGVSASNIGAATEHQDGAKMHGGMNLKMMLESGECA
jgi:hypothetical protein